MDDPGPDGPGDLPPLGGSILRLAVRIALLLGVAALVLNLMDWAMGMAEQIDPTGRLMLGTLALFLIAYAALIALPFVPGIEIGVSLLVMKGEAVAPFVYLATVGGLVAAFAGGRMIPEPALRTLFADLRLRRACAMIDRIKGLSRQERLGRLRHHLPARLRPVAGRWRYLALGILFNLPGNALLGGGGGIAMLAGLSRLFATGPAILTIALAVLPVPLLVWLFGGAMLGIG